MDPLHATEALVYHSNGAMADAATPRLIVKIGADGGVHLNFKPATFEQLKEGGGPQPSGRLCRLLFGVAIPEWL